jgi:Mrp family chromosome partitioning ATPase/capsular polysaccharide biosynthesis protein
VSILDFLRKVMSRWRVVAACALVGVLAALLTLPTPKHQPHVPVPYVVSTRLGVSLKASPGSTSKGQTATTVEGGGEVSHLAALGLNPQVAQAAAAALGGKENPKKLAESVSYGTDFTRNNVVVKAKDLQPERATAVSKAFANALISVAVDEQVAQQQKNEQFLQNQLNNIAQKIKGGNSTASTTSPTTVARAGKAPKAATPGEVNRSAGLSTDAIAQAQLSAELSKYTTLYGQLQDLESTDATKPPMQILTVGKPTLDKALIKAAPKNISHKLWAAGGLAAGLLVGLIAALILSALDRSLGNPTAFEDAFGLPVLADIPTLSNGARRSGVIVTADRPLSAGAEEYRRLRTALERMPAHIMPMPGGQPAPLGEARDPRSGSRRADGTIQAVALVGAGPRLGTTTSVANLGSALAEARVRPLLVDLNLRRPRLHQLLRTDASPGATEEVDGSPPADRDCRLAGVRLLPAGSPVSNPAAYIGRAAGLVAAWRTRADVVVLDVANLASANDLADLADEVDALVVVCGKRMTTRKDAKATTNMLGVLGAPVLGLLLVDVRPSWQDRLQRRLPPRVATPKGPVENVAGLEPAPAVAATAPNGSAPASADGGNEAMEASELVTSPVTTAHAPAEDERPPSRITQRATPLPTETPSLPTEASDPPETSRRRARWRRG